MSKRFRNIPLLPASLVFSILLHLFGVTGLQLFRVYDFSDPVREAAVGVELLGRDEMLPPPGQPENAAQQVASPGPGGRETAPERESQRFASAKEDAGEAGAAGSEAPAGSSAPAVDAPSSPVPSAAVPSAPIPFVPLSATAVAAGALAEVPAAQASAQVEPFGAGAKEPSRLSSAAPVPAENAAPPEKGPAPAMPGRWRAASSVPQPLVAEDFLSALREKLSYRISMQGIPVGSAELEARNERGGVSISLRVRSNAVVSGIFPVDDAVEVQHVDGRFIMVKLRQKEGAFRSDETCSFNLPKRRIFCFDVARNLYAREEVPSDDVLDSLSGIYYLRNRTLEVGRTETLHIYDSETYAEVPVEILRREELRLPNLTTVATVVVHPLQKTSGMFRRTGDIFIWMTDDEHKVPVRIVTSVPLGRITAELVAAEATYPGDAGAPSAPLSPPATPAL